MIILLFWLTRPHRAPSCVATIVAALGVLYISASSPKLPLLSYFPTHTLNPSFCTKISYTPLEITWHTDRYWSHCKADELSSSANMTEQSNLNLTSLSHRNCPHRLLGLWCGAGVLPTPRTWRPKPQRTAPGRHDAGQGFFRAAECLAQNNKDTRGPSEIKLKNMENKSFDRNEHNWELFVSAVCFNTFRNEVPYYVNNGWWWGLGLRFG